MNRSAAFYYAIPNLDEREERVLSFIRGYPNMSRNDIARAAHMDPENVSCRIADLLRKGEIVVVGKKKDRITGRTVRTYGLREASA